MRETFPIAPSSGFHWQSPGVLISMAVVVFLFLVLFVWPRYSSQHVRFELDAAGLAIRGDMYGRTIPWSGLELGKARTLNLSEQTDFRLKWRTNGKGLPGYKSGWFKLANGEKALAFITDPTRVVYVPTTDGYAVMMSVLDPAAFLNALRQRAPK